MNPTDRPETTTDNVRYLVTIDLERGRTLKVLRQMPDGSLHEVTRRPLPPTRAQRLPHPPGLRVTPALQTLH